MRFAEHTTYLGLRARRWLDQYSKSKVLDSRAGRLAISVSRCWCRVDDAVTGSNFPYASLMSCDRILLMQNSALGLLCYRLGWSYADAACRIEDVGACGCDEWPFELNGPAVPNNIKPILVPTQ